jgi:uncharacterized protein
MRPILTPSLFYQHAACPHWIWYDRYGDPTTKGELPELAQKLLDQGVVHEENYIRGLELTPVKPKNPAAAFKTTLTLMRQGAPVIYQGAIEAEIGGAVWRGRPDLLEKRSGKSKLGDHFYVPVDIKSSHSIHKEQQLQLAFYAMVLKELQGRQPGETAIINVDHERVPFRPTALHLAKTRKKAAEILVVLSGEKPPLRLTSKCKRSPWFSQCVADAEEANDIALIYDLDSRAHPALRKAGIRTVDDAAAMDVSRLPKIAYLSAAKLEKAKLQAQSLQDGELRWLKRPNIPDAPVRIYFDIEGDPLLDVQYLFGFWIEGQAAKPRYEYFLAEQPEDEERMWNQFLEWTATLPKSGYKVYHYADYERAHTLRLAKEYGSSPAFEAFASHYVDMLKIVKESVVFPLYFYSIKDIAKSKFLDYKWRHKKAGGAQSIFWYEEWLETGDRRVLQDIIDYNEDDVVATAHLHKWLMGQVF